MKVNLVLAKWQRHLIVVVFGEVDAIFHLLQESFIFL